MRTTIVVSLLIIGLIGCDTLPSSGDREGKLLTLAAGEAQQIKDSQQRLSRQLNFASRQIDRGKQNEARQSLAYAAQTLRDAKPGELNPQVQIGGWVSISELSRVIDDQPTARIACNQAVDTLRSLQPNTDRPDYVIGVAAEVRALSGKPAAAKLLEESSDWIRQMQPPTLKRVALVAICDTIFDDDDYTGGLAVLRTDSDATWRSDTLAMLAEQSRFEPTSITQAAVGGLVSRNVPRPLLRNLSDDGRPMTDSSETNQTISGQTPIFGKPVDFQSVFKGKIGSDDLSATKP